MSEHTPVLVIGATGHVGGQVATQLRAGGRPVRALVRDPASATLPPGVTPVRGDLSTPESLDAAATGVEAAFLMWPLPDAGPATGVLAALARHVRRLVFLSSAAVQPENAEGLGRIGELHAGVEQAIRRSGLEWTFLRPYGFATNLLNWAPYVREGAVPGVHGAATMTLIHERDIAAVAVAALTRSGHAGAAYELTGPEQLTQVEQARIIGEVIGRPVRWEEVSPDTARKGLLRWLPDSFAEVYLEGLARTRTELLPVTDTVERVTGVPARTFREWVADHADDFR
ncbi:NAD(P)H-binding protein [Amycolatopsis cihanbeyliensis]|uniref:Uncharacterized protein YbjT (DUF2867 family) n=1 Tax=Amycolatopsis cihanbeyliensis TaxID=1128664 RepID=A0A542DCB4_AMYCI|nr:NAD(P)H-binding protein [Amycolatopsis cihanbeyliensis]TQJ00710.1 uncharacterized protein YbjT (DUF2867 family) [Amycolatopsis cihanbeyliensis]